MCCLNQSTVFLSVRRCYMGKIQSIQRLVCYTAVFSVVTQRSSRGGALRDDTKKAV